MIDNVVYLDNNATTQLDERVFNKMLPFFMQSYGNPDSKYYQQAELAKKAVEKSREQCAKLIGAKSEEIYFTSGATESNNIAIKGFCLANFSQGKHIVTSLIEHSSVLEPIKELQESGFNVTCVKPNHYGMISAEVIEDVITNDTILVSVMLANNELGTINPVDQIAEICHKKNVFFHCDSTQGIGKIQFQINKIPVDMISFTGHKIYGPKGVGGLFIKKKQPRIKIHSIIKGGGQEKGLRSGTLNVSGIVGLGYACEFSGKLRVDESNRIQILSDKLIKNLSSIEAITFNNHPVKRLPGTINFSIDGIDAESLLSRIADRVALSSGSACSSKKTEVSHVLKGIGLTDSVAKSTIRISIGRFNTEEEIDNAIEILKQEIKQLRTLL